MTPLEYTLTIVVCYIVSILVVGLVGILVIKHVAKLNIVKG